jgi:hypothetical protein
MLANGGISHSRIPVSYMARSVSGRPSVKAQNVAESIGGVATWFIRQADRNLPDQFYAVPARVLALFSAAADKDIQHS